MFRQTFSKSQRLLRSKEYEKVLNFGFKRKTGHFILFLRPNGKADHRLGMIVTKKVANSVGRNRIKRMIRDYFRTDYKGLAKKKAPHDIVFIAKKVASQVTIPQIRQELKELYE